MSKKTATSSRDILTVTADQKAEIDNLVQSCSMLLPEFVALLGELASPTANGTTIYKQAAALQARLQALKTKVESLPGVDLTRSQQIDLYNELNAALQKRINLLEKYRNLELLRLQENRQSNN